MTRLLASLLVLIALCGAARAQVPVCAPNCPTPGYNYIVLLGWSTAGRPSSPYAGQTSYNTTTHLIETWNGSAWVTDVSSFNTRVGAVTLTLGDVTGVLDTGTPIAGDLVEYDNSSGLQTDSDIPATSVVTSGTLITAACPISWPSILVVQAGTYPCFVSAWSGTTTITKVQTYTNGTGTPSFNVTVQINGTSVTGCTALSVTLSATENATCTAANTMSLGDQASVLISSVSGVPDQALVQLVITHKPN